VVQGSGVGTGIESVVESRRVILELEPLHVCRAGIEYAGWAFRPSGAESDSDPDSDSGSDHLTG
jgi:hypothetical protein